MVRQVSNLNESIEDDTNVLRRNWTQQTEKQNDLIAKTTQKTLAMFEGFKGVGEVALNLSTGGFLKVGSQA